MKISPLFYSGISDLDHLRRLLAERDEKIAKLIELLMPTSRFSSHWKLTPNQAAFLNILLQHTPHVVEPDEILRRLGPRRKDSGNNYLYNIVQRTREKISPIKISNGKSRGYFLSKESATAINQINQFELFPDYTEHS